MTRKIAVMGTGDDLVDQTEVPDLIGQSAHVGFEPILEPVPNAVFPDSPKARQLTIDAYVEAGKRLARQDYAALYINTMGDYGLQTLRQQIDMPVAGSGEASIRAALSLGRCFSIVTIWPPKFQFIYDYVLEDAGAADACRSLHFLSADDELQTMNQGDDFYSNMRSCNVTSLQQVRKTVELAVERDGADIVILGCTCMSHLGPILKEDGLPVIEPMVTGYIYTEFLGGL